MTETNKQLNYTNLLNKKMFIISNYPAQNSGTWKVLKSYLNILKEWQEEYHFQIHVAFVEQHNNPTNEAHLIPEPFTFSHILSEIETDFMRRSWYTEGHWEHTDYIRSVFNKKMLKLINSYAPDLVIDFDGDMVCFDDFMSAYDLNTRVPLIKFIHGKIVLDIYRSASKYYEIVLPKTHVMVSINRDMMNRYQEFAGDTIKNKEVTFLYNPFHLNTIQNLRFQVEDEETEQLLNENYIIAIGRDAPQKNYPEMLQIYAQLKQRGLQYKLYILGMDVTQNSLISQIQQLGLENDVRILGIKSNVFRFLEKAKLLIHTAVHEGLCGAVIESLACATPVVVMDCPTGMDEILDGGKYGMLVPLHDQAQFIEKVEFLLNNPNEYQHYADLSAQRAKDFDVSQIAEQFLGMLNRSFEYTK